MGTPAPTRPALWRDLVLFTLVTAFCAYSASAVLKSQAPHRLLSPKTEAERQPAAVGSPQPAAAERSTATMEFHCQESPALAPAAVERETEAGLLQITGRHCRSARLSGVNETTGEQLLVFDQGARFSTHYFPLAKGSNKIVLRWEGGKGPKGSGSLLVTRKESEAD